ncbi:hypothetical protein QCA50_020770 [Cerrena zonata]|uniref:Uncharacterized protein n=1 Tax=Cerrena zonata TaxID=2478898 RepID=A0AAW0FDU7_9APHY
MSNVSHAAIVFPRPPPTCNTLTPEERAKLLRSTAKLGQLLGSTPHVVDEITDLPMNKPLPLPPLPGKPRRSGLSGVASRDENAEWQKIRVHSPDSVSSSTSRASTSSSRSSLSHSASAIATNAETEEGWRVRFSGLRPPLLRLGFGKSDKIPTYTPPPSYDIDTSFPDTETSPPPNFVIRSDASIKREKMRRLTKKLGEGVPVDLVFPPSVAEEDEEVIIHSPSSPSSPSSTMSSNSSLDSATSSSSTSTTSTLLSVHSDSSSSYGKSRMRHESYYQAPRRSHFVKDLPDFPCQERQLTIHYETPEEHGYGSETFEGLKRAIAPTSRTKRAPVPRKPVPRIQIP